MSYLAKLKSLKTPIQLTAKTAKSPFDSFGSDLQRQFSSKNTLLAVLAVTEGGSFQEKDNSDASKKGLKLPIQLTAKTAKSTCPLCGGDLSSEGTDGCYHRAGEVPFPEQVIDGLHPCSICGGEFFYEGSRGGYFCKKCQSLPEGAEPVQVVRGNTPRGKNPLSGDDPGYIRGTRGIEAPSHPAKMTSPKISPVALEWLRANRQALQCNGWTMAGLYRRNRGKGLAWAGIWDIADMTATLQEGMIVIDFRDGGKVVRQTARPMPQRKL
jgi:hypothetical protein